jgi:hypothetical protein
MHDGREQDNVLEVVGECGEIKMSNFQVRLCGLKMSTLLT